MSVGNNANTSAGNAFVVSALLNSYVALYLVTGFAVNVHVPLNLTSLPFTVCEFAAYPLNVHLPLATVTSVFAGCLAFTVSPFTYSSASVGNNANTSGGNAVAVSVLVNSYVTLYLATGLATNSHLPTNSTLLPFTVCWFAAYPLNTHLPSATSTSAFAGCLAFTVSPFTYSSVSVGSKSFTACGNSFPAVSLSNLYPTVYLATGFALYSHFPTNSTSLSPIVTGPAGSYPLNSHLPSATVTCVCPGCLAFTCSPFLYLAASVGNKSFTSCGNSFPAVPLSNLYVALCSLATNSHFPTNSTLLPFTVCEFVAYPLNTHLPSCAASSTSVCAGCLAFTVSPFTYSSASVGSKSFTACGNSFPAVALSNLYPTVYLATGFALYSHLPTNSTSLSPIVTGPAGSYPLNSHLPSATVTCVCPGCLAFTCSPFLYLAASVGNKSFTSCGNSFPAVPLSNLYVALCSLATNSHLPTNLTSSVPTVTGPAGSYPLNTHLPSSAATSTSVCAG